MITNTQSFNPRPRVGGDEHQAEAGDKVLGFNPRPRVGGDTCNRRIGNIKN